MCVFIDCSSRSPKPPKIQKRWQPEESDSMSFEQFSSMIAHQFRTICPLPRSQSAALVLWQFSHTDYFWRTTQHVTSPQRHFLSALTQFPASSSFPMITSVLVFAGLDVQMSLFSKLFLISSSILLDISFPPIHVGSSQQGGMTCLLRPGIRGSDLAPVLLGPRTRPLFYPSVCARTPTSNLS